MDSEYSVLEDSVGYCRRDDRGRLLLRGADRLTYLHGLLTNDMAALSPGTGCYAALLTPQGRMICDMRVFELPEGMTLVDTDRSVVAQLREHLDRFVITEDVTIDDVTERLAAVGVYGPRAASATEHITELALDIDALSVHQSRAASFGGEPLHVIATDDMGVRGFELVTNAQLAADLERALAAAGAVHVSFDTLETARIVAGMPRFPVDMDTSTIPLEAGIEDRAISMTKGCYVGQEVIVRVLHRGGGRVAKRLVKLEAPSPVRVDDRIVSGDREIGRVTSASEAPGGGFVALGYVQRDFVAPGTPVQIGEADGAVRA